LGASGPSKATDRSAGSEALPECQTTSNGDDDDEYQCSTSELSGSQSSDTHKSQDVEVLLGRVTQQRHRKRDRSSSVEIGQPPPKKVADTGTCGNLLALPRDPRVTDSTVKTHGVDTLFDRSVCGVQAYDNPEFQKMAFINAFSYIRQFHTWLQPSVAGSNIWSTNKRSPDGTLTSKCAFVHNMPDNLDNLFTQRDSPKFSWFCGDCKRRHFVARTTHHIWILLGTGLMTRGVWANYIHHSQSSSYLFHSVLIHFR
jgi:hypothetical protein